MTSPVLCIGSALWDIVARTSVAMTPGHDAPGRIARQPGGVALNVAIALAARGAEAAILSAVGRDAEGDALCTEMARRGINLDGLTRIDDPTDCYLALESEGALFGAVADCASLEKAGTTVLAPLSDGRMGSPSAPFDGIAVIDGNLPVATIESLIASGDLDRADRYFIPASPGKARRMATVLADSGGTLVMNRTETEILFERPFASARDAAQAIAAKGIDALVTDSARAACLMRGDRSVTATPPTITPVTVTGAGDAFLAGFLDARRHNQDDAACLDAALAVAAHHVSGGAYPAPMPKDTRP